MNVRVLTFAFLTALLLAVPGRQAKGQVLEDLRVFGYFQSYFSHVDGNTILLTRNIPATDRRNTFNQQQLNLLFAKDLADSFSAFANVELTNSFSSKDGWGSVKLEEAWVRYNHSSALNVKAGLQIPTFNNLNEIKNRTPLLPYIFRPSVYEAAYDEFLPTRVFVPNQAYVQVYGGIPLGGTRLDYSVYVGNQDAFITDTTWVSAVTGVDTTKALMVGGRLGLRHRSLKLGVSGTTDNDNLDFLGLGAVRRFRLGADLSFTFERFFFEGEFIAIRYNPTDLQQGSLSLIAQNTPLIGNDLDKFFYYALLGYNITDKWFVYAYRDYMDDQVIRVLRGGFDVLAGGGGYKPVDPVVIKIQGTYTETNKKDHYKGTFLLIGVSVLF